MPTLTQLDAARTVLGLCRLLWLRRARDEDRGVMLQGSPKPLREAALRLAQTIDDAEAQPEGSEAQQAAIGRTAEAIEGIAGALIPTDGVMALLELGAQLVRGTRAECPTPPRRWGQ